HSRRTVAWLAPRKAFVVQAFNNERLNKFITVSPGDPAANAYTHAAFCLRWCTDTDLVARGPIRVQAPEIRPRSTRGNRRSLNPLTLCRPARIRDLNPSRSGGAHDGNPCAADS